MQARICGALLTALLGACWLARAQEYTYHSRIEHPIVRYEMSARLDPKTKTVKGHYQLTWWNHSEDSVPDLHFHLYLNAFKNMDSTFMRESSARRRAEELQGWLTERDADKWGWVDIDKIQIVGGADLTASKAYVHPDDDNAADQTVARFPLPRPVPPHGTLELAVDFTSKLPRAVARNGYEGDYFLLAQWFPKIGVYESSEDLARKHGNTPKQGAWNCHQYHSNTEFFADYGVYDVELTAPSNYVVGSTGFLRSSQGNSEGTTTYHYFQEDVHDFAWTAYPEFIRITRTFDWRKEANDQEITQWSRTLNLPPDRIALRNVNVTFLLQPGHENVADRYFRAVFNGLKYFGLWYGQYPYDTLTVVDTPRHSATCCMEYPTFITVGTYFWPAPRGLSPEGVTVHEFGHQFWYGLVGNNEFEEAWLDEGFNTYSTGKVLETAYGAGSAYQYFFGMPIPLVSWLSVHLPPFPFAGVGSIPIGPYFSSVQEPERSAGRGFYASRVKDDNLVRRGWEYIDGSSYGLNSYTRVGLTLRTLEGYLGSETMARVMRTYHQRWRFGHPTTRDFIAAVNEVSGRNMDWFFQQFFYSSNLPDYAVTEITTAPIEGKIGIYDEAGKKAFHAAQEAREASQKSKEKRYRSTVLVRRLGEAAAPVDVLVRFDNGDTVREQWDGQYRWIKYVYEKASQVKSADVDPDRKLVLDTNYTNNSRLRNEDNSGAAKWYVRWIFWLENLFFAAGFFS